MKRKSTRGRAFKTALADATKRFVKATKERTETQKRLLALDAEIPALQGTIMALQRQLTGKGVMPSVAFDSLHLPKMPINPTCDVTGEHRAETSASIPPELAAYVGPQDMTGFGSIQHDPNKPVQLSEDETLPPIEGTPLTPQ